MESDMAETASLTIPQPVQTVVPTKRRWALPVLLSLVAAVYLANSFAPVIFDETEGQYAGAAREMLQSGQWLVPTNDGIPRLQKPPLLFLCARLGQRNSPLACRMRWRQSVGFGPSA
jgi:hypothetical protein